MANLATGDDMLLARPIGLALTLVLTLGLTGCSETLKQWDAGFVSAPAHHRQAVSTQRHVAAVRDPGTTASTTPIAAPAATETLLQACKRHLYLDTATSTDDIRVAEAACKDIIVNQPIGGGVN